jgi:hypothetical protein
LTLFGLADRRGSSSLVGRKKMNGESVNPGGPFMGWICEFPHNFTPEHFKTNVFPRSVYNIKKLDKKLAIGYKDS